MERLREQQPIQESQSRERRDTPVQNLDFFDTTGMSAAEIESLNALAQSLEAELGMETKINIGNSQPSETGEFEVNQFSTGEIDFDLKREEAREAIAELLTTRITSEQDQVNLENKLSIESGEFTAEQLSQMMEEGLHSSFANIIIEKNANQPELILQALDTYNPATIDLSRIPNEVFENDAVLQKALPIINNRISLKDKLPAQKRMSAEFLDAARESGYTNIVDWSFESMSEEQAKQLLKANIRNHPYLLAHAPKSLRANSGFINTLLNIAPEQKGKILNSADTSLAQAHLEQTPKNLIKSLLENQ